MKKRMILFVLCFALSLGGIIAAGRAIYSTGDQVEITETVLYGDPSWAEGTTLTGHYGWSNYYDGFLYWDTTYTVGELDNTQTEFEFTTSDRWVHRYDSQASFYADAFCSVGFSTSGSIDLEFEYFYGYEPFVRELAAELDAGESRSVTVNLNDYYEYYPFRYNISTATASVSSDELPYMKSDDPNDPWYLAYEALLSHLDDFFRVPLAENSRTTITLTRDERGNLVEFDAQMADGIRTPEFLSASGENAIYITFATAYCPGYFDYSQVPGGLGVYRLPYEEEDIIVGSEDQGIQASFPAIHTDQLENIHSLPNDTAILHLEASADQSQIFLLTQEEGNLTLTVLDAGTGELQQRLALFPLDLERDILRSVQVYEDFLFCVLENGRFAMIARQEDGSWQVGLVSALPEAEQVGRITGLYECTDLTWQNWLFLNNIEYTAFFWDGETLTMAFPIIRWSPQGETDVLLTVYDSAGLRYLGRYQTSLNPAGVDLGSIGRVGFDEWLEQPLELLK